MSNQNIKYFDAPEGFWKLLRHSACLVRMSESINMNREDIKENQMSRALYYMEDALELEEQAWKMFFDLIEEKNHEKFYWTGERIKKKVIRTPKLDPQS